MIEVLSFAIKVLSFAIEVLSFVIEVPSFTIEVLRFTTKVPSFAIEVLSFTIEVLSFTTKVRNMAVKVPSFAREVRNLMSDDRRLENEVETMNAHSQTVYLPDAKATRQLGIQLGRSLPLGTVLLLEGDLGSGKTTLVQGIGEGLGITEAIDSPTFTLINEYLSGRIPLYHFDLYRLEPSQTVTLYPEIYWEGVEVEPGIVAIEWSERLPYTPESYLELRLLHQAEGRQAELTAIGQTLDEFKVESLRNLQ